MNGVDLLKKIKSKPYVFLGKPSASSLFEFILGYQYCMHEQGKNCFVIPAEFTEKLAFQHEMHTLSAPMIALELCSGDEEAAFYKFYELLDEFLEEKINSS